MKKCFLFLLITTWALSAMTVKLCRAEDNNGAGQNDDAAVSAIDITSVGEIIGKPVRNQAGEHLGSVAGVLGEESEIHYIILSSEKLGGAERLIPLPVRSTGARIAKDSIVVDLNKDRLGEAPDFRRDDRPDFSLPEWNQKIRGYYGAESGEHPKSYYMLLR